MHNLFDPLFNGMARSELYRSLIEPDLYPDEPPVRLNNWLPEDVEDYTGRGG